MSTSLPPMNWCEWVPLIGASRDERIPRGAGLYRIRVAGGGPVVYIGQTGRDLRERLGQLRGAFEDEMPYRDPHTAAPGLWALRHRDGCDFESSACSVAGDSSFRLGMEALALSTHREKELMSPALNFGGMPDGYRRSSANNAGLVRSGRRSRGGLDTATAPKLASHPPGAPLGGMVVADSWMGHAWSAWVDANSFGPQATGLYRIRRPDEPVLLYIGQGVIRSRIRAHVQKGALADHRQASYFAGNLAVSFVVLDAIGRRALLEIENDLIAAHMVVVGRPPSAQFIG